MKLLTLVRSLTALNVKVGSPKDAVGHTYAADARNAKCQRCDVAVPAKRQYTAVECAGRVVKLEDYASDPTTKTTEAPSAPKVKRP